RARLALPSSPTRRSSDLTHGKVDFFTLAGAGKPATYGPQIEVVNGISPPFADCSIRARPSQPLLCLLNKVYGWNNQAYSTISPRSEEHTSELQSRENLVC